MKSSRAILVLIITLLTITSCDQVYDSVISFADMTAEEVLEGVTDEILIESCSNEKYTNTLKITKNECSDLMLSRKEACLANVKNRWKNKLSKKSDVEAVATVYVKCVMKINKATESDID